MATCKNTNAQIAECKDCKLCEIDANMVRSDDPRFGKVLGYPLDIKTSCLMFVAQNPACNRTHKALDHKLFYKDSVGNIFCRALEACGLNREEVYCTNIVKCSTTDNMLPEEASVDACKKHLLSEIRCINPKCLIAVGSFADKYLSELRNKNQLIHNIPKMHIQHPAFVLRGGVSVEDYIKRFAAIINANKSQTSLTEFC